MSGGEIARLDFIAVAPITAPRAFEQIATDGQMTRLPLPQDMKILMQDEIGIAPEIFRRVPQQDPAAARGRASARMQTRVHRVFDDADVIDALGEYFLERAKAL
jgi:hypothetical protein